jgi:anti-anti-sigma factor
MGSDLVIEVTTQQGRVPITIFHLKGSIDASNSDQLERAAAGAYEAGARNMILDLSNVTFMSSIGLRTLHSIFDMLRATSVEESGRAIDQGLRDGTFKSRHLKLVSPPTAVRQVLTMIGFDMFLEIHHNLQEAVASF